MTADIEAAKNEVYVDATDERSSTTDFLDFEEQKAAIRNLAEEYNVNEKKLMAKIDFRLVPALCILYLLAFLDRVNMGNANIYGLSKDLKLDGNKYNVALTIFFVPYTVFEIPANYLMKKFKPHVWLSFCMVMFGVLSIAQGFVKNYGQLIVTRFFLGLFESGMFPGCFYLLSMWYRREEGQKRFSFFFTSTSLAGAFGGLISYGCNSISGARGITGWQWIFIIEGAITAFVAVILFFGICDFPESVSWMKDNERAFLKAKLELDCGSSQFNQKLGVKGALRTLMKPELWMATIGYFSTIFTAYGYAYFSPSIIQGLYKTPVSAQLHSVPPWVCAFGFSMVLAYFADKFRHRFSFCVIGTFVGIAGAIMLLANHDNIHLRYAACHLIASGSYGAMPLIVCWASQNVAGHQQKAVATALLIGFGNINAIPSTFSFQATDAPFYTKGVALSLAFDVLFIIVTSIYFFLIWNTNRKKEKGLYDDKWNAMTPEQRAQEPDKNPSFRYSY